MKTSQIKLKNSLILLLTAAIWGAYFRPASSVCYFCF